jgi:hypothetical protein
MEAAVQKTRVKQCLQATKCLMLADSNSDNDPAAVEVHKVLG